MDLRALATECLNLMTDAFIQVKAKDVFKAERSTDVAKKAAITLVSTYTAYSAWKLWRKKIYLSTSLLIKMYLCLHMLKVVSSSIIYFSRRISYSRMLEGIPKNNGLDEVNFGLFTVHVSPDDGADMILRLNDGGSDNTVNIGVLNTNIEFSTHLKACHDPFPSSWPVLQR